MMAMVAGCGERRDKTGGQMKPEETVEAFCKAVARGDFKTAMPLCDTLTMKEYIDNYVQAWDVLVQKDSGAVAIAASSLAESVFTVDDITKDGEKRIVSYTITAGDGMQKKKSATVKKEEGEWKVEKITDIL